VGIPESANIVEGLIFMPQKYSVIVFDLGNVLLPIDFSKLKAELDRYDFGLGERFSDRYRQNIDIHNKYEGGKLSEEEFLKIMMDWTENFVPKEKFCEIYSDIFCEDKNVINLLGKLKKEYRLILLSNTSYIHQKYGWEKYNFSLHFEKMFLSYEIGVMKPDEKIYSLLQNYTQQPAEEHLFIDDLTKNIKTAKKIGWDGIQFLGYEKLLKDLSIRKIIIE